MNNTYNDSWQKVYYQIFRLIDTIPFLFLSLNCIQNDCYSASNSKTQEMLVILIKRSKISNLCDIINQYLFYCLAIVTWRSYLVIKCKTQIRHPNTGRTKIYWQIVDPTKLSPTNRVKIIMNWQRSVVISTGEWAKPNQRIYSLAGQTQLKLNFCLVITQLTDTNR